MTDPVTPSERTISAIINSNQGVAGIYGEIAKVSKDFAKLMHAAATRDANTNALGNLDIFTIKVPSIAEDMLQQIRPYFSAHLKDS